MLGGLNSNYCPGWMSSKFKLPKNVCIDCGAQRLVMAISGFKAWTVLSGCVER
jgi:hypothetical protein